MFEDQPYAELHERFANKDWFHSVGFDKYHRLVVYVKYMCDETTNGIPQQLGGVRILVHFAGSKNIKKELYAHKGYKPKEVFVSEAVEDLGDSDDIDFIEEPNTPLDLRELIDELVRLEKMSGSNIMQDIFYEVHDGVNAVTNLSSKFPEVRQGMEKLYHQYGFDLIYENMDG
jgi:hypothetical protein